MGTVKTVPVIMDLVLFDVYICIFIIRYTTNSSEKLEIIMTILVSQCENSGSRNWH